MLLGREHPAGATARPVGFEQQPPGRRGEAAAREIAPAVPAGVVGVGRGADGDADVLEAFGAVGFVGQAARSAISFLVSAIALAGLRPLGQTFAQFMIVWQR